MRAARQALKDREVLILSKALETTLSGQGIKWLVGIAGSAGYKINLAYICLDSPDKSMKRIAASGCTVVDMMCRSPISGEDMNMA